MTSRLTKILMSLGLALFAFMVTFGNITDYGSNFAFVQHVLSMDTTFPDNALQYRAITTPALWHAGYWLIILGEGLCCLLFLCAAIAMWNARCASAARFAAAKRWFIWGATTAFGVWFVGFMVIGGEWFAMWQSSTWNGQEAAFRFYVTALVVLLFVNQPDGELGTPTAS